MIPIWLGTDDGVLHLDGSALFERGLKGRSIRAVAVDPFEPAHIIAGVGRCQPGDGPSCFRSQDAGRSWSALDVGVPEVWGARFHPSLRGVVALGAQPAELLLSEDGGRTWARPHGLAEVPAASGWTFVHPPWQAHLLDIAFSNGGLFAAVEVGGILYSEDNGRTWEDLTKGADPDVHSLALRNGHLWAATGRGIFVRGQAGWQHRGPSDRYTVGICWSGDVGLASAAGSRRSLLRTVDGGNTWAFVEPSPAGPDHGATTLVMVGNEVWFAGKREVFRSVDGGVSFSSIVKGLPTIRRVVIEQGKSYG